MFLIGFILMLMTQPIMSADSSNIHFQFSNPIVVSGFGSKSSASSDVIMLPEIKDCPSPAVSLEHVNINVNEWNAKLQNFYINGLGFVKDERADVILHQSQSAGSKTEKGLVWINIGLQQLHLTDDNSNQAQVINGKINLIYPNIQELCQRLKENNIDFIQKDHTHIITKCPFGNRFQITQQDLLSGESGNKRRTHWFGPSPLILQGDASIALPGKDGKSSLGLGIQSIEYDVPINTVESISKFYEKYFGILCSINQNSSYNNHDYKSSDDHFKQCSVPVGFHQNLIFSEKSGAPNRYVGEHICIYINDFVFAYENLQKDNLIYENERFPQFQYKNVRDILKFNEFRFKDIVDEKGNLLFELEHEIRSCAHPSFCGSKAAAKFMQQHRIQ